MENSPCTAHVADEAIPAVEAKYAFKVKQRVRPLSWQSRRVTIEQRDRRGLYNSADVVVYIHAVGHGVA